jgi:hypothetical protein
LNYDEHPGQQIFPSESKGSPDDPYGLNAGKHNTGIKSGEHRNQNRRTSEQSEMRNGQDISFQEVFIGQAVKERQQQKSGYQGYGHGHDNDHERFAPELADQVFPSRTQYLSHPDLNRSGRGSADSQIREIDAGDKKDEQTDPSQDVGFGNLVFPLSFNPLRVQIDVFDILEP